MPFSKSRMSCTFGGISLHTKENFIIRQHWLISLDPVFFHSNHAPSAQNESSGKIGFSLVSQAGLAVVVGLTGLESLSPSPSPLRVESCIEPLSK